MYYLVDLLFLVELFLEDFYMHLKIVYLYNYLQKFHCVVKCLVVRVTVGVESLDKLDYRSAARRDADIRVVDVKDIPHFTVFVEKYVAVSGAVEPRDFARNYGIILNFFELPKRRIGNGHAYAIVGTPEIVCAIKHNILTAALEHSRAFDSYSVAVEFVRLRGNVFV